MLQLYSHVEKKWVVSLQNSFMDVDCFELGRGYKQANGPARMTQPHSEMHESGWSSGMKLEFYPSISGLTTTRVKTEKKDQKPTSVLLMTASHKAYLKNVKNET